MSHPNAAAPLPSVDSWESTRSRFSHDWLRNRLAVALGKYRNVLAGAVADADAHAQLGSLVAQWAEQRAHVAELIEQACDVLSPRRGFARPALAALDAASLREVADAADTTWRQDCRPERAAERARQALGGLDAALHALADGVAGIAAAPRDAVSPELLTALERARSAVTVLAEAMTELGRCRRH